MLPEEEESLIVQRRCQDKNHVSYCNRYYLVDAENITVNPPTRQIFQKKHCF